MGVSSANFLCRSVCKEYSAHYEKSLTVARPSKDLRRKINVSPVDALRLNFIQSCCVSPQAIESDMELIEIIACRSKVWRDLRLRRLIENLSKYTLNGEWGTRLLYTILFIPSAWVLCCPSYTHLCLSLCTVLPNWTN